MGIEQIVEDIEKLLRGGHTKINTEAETREKHEGGDRRRNIDQNGEEKEKSGRYISTKIKR